MALMPKQLVTIQTEHGVALLTLNRPEARNAMNVDLARATVEALQQLQSERAIVVTGAGSAFCAGLDLRALGTTTVTDMPPFVEVFRRSAVPVIAAVNGAAVTGGLELALACDFIVASDRARFADTHLRVGVYPGPVLVDLPRRIGMAKARELSLTGNFIQADEALRWGLVNHVVSHDTLVPFTLGLARDIAEVSPAMVQAMRTDWNQTSALPLADAHRRHSEFMRVQAKYRS